MHTLLDVFVVASFGFIGTMFDNFFAFAAQLMITERSRYRRVGWAQASGVGVLLLLAAGVGSLLTPIPVRWIGLLCLAPWALAAHAWRHRGDPSATQYRRGAVTTFAVTLALGGDNLAVWIPLLRANGVSRAAVTIITFVLWEALFVVGAQALTARPRLVAWGSRFAPDLIPWIYLALGVLILVECGTL
ncbi:MAG TPA: cadmium resistance transporter [Acidimicrobiales bacterium]|nr:cadmium resistance transporter [Acidimicrobiales bacterium]